MSDPQQLVRRLDGFIGIYGVQLDDEDVQMLEEVSAVLSTGAVSQVEPKPNYATLAGAMKKMLPAALLAEVVAHLDPVTPFVKFLRNHDGPTVGRNCNSPRYPMAAGAVPSVSPAPQEQECSCPTWEGAHAIDCPVTLAITHGRPALSTPDLSQLIATLQSDITNMGISWNHEAARELDGAPLRLWDEDGDPVPDHPWIAGQCIARERAAEVVREFIEALLAQTRA